MSARYSHSLGLVLRIRQSRIRSRLHALLGLAGAASLGLVWQAGEGALALGLCLPWCLLLWLTGRDRAAGLQIHYRDSTWSIVRGAEYTVVIPETACVCLPGLVQFCWRETGRSGVFGVWLFADSATAGELSALRRRLELER